MLSSSSTGSTSVFSIRSDLTFTNLCRSVDDKYKCTQKINYVHYDPQMHWCKQCNIFPKTAKGKLRSYVLSTTPDVLGLNFHLIIELNLLPDFLIHLHSKEHQDSQKIIEPPWHDKQINDVSQCHIW